MPVTPTYPGVYIEEVPSSVRTITGVATSITAFVGRAQRGPVNDPITINNYGDYERIFGGLWLDSAMSYAVSDFFQNGGGQAIIVRLHSGAKKSTLKIKSGAADLLLESADPGSWGNHLRVRIDHDVSQDFADRYEDIDKADLYNLTVTDVKVGVTEQFRNLTVKASPRQIDKVLENESNLIRVKTLSNNIPVPHVDPATGKTIWEDDNASQKVADTAADKGSDGVKLKESDFDKDQSKKEGLYALENADLFNLLCIPPHALGVGGDIESTLIGKAANYCVNRRAIYLVDASSSWKDKDSAKKDISKVGTDSNSAKNAALFFPRLSKPNLLRDNQMEDFAPCGAVAGVIARTDAQRGIWKSPAGLDAGLSGVPKMSVPLTDAENGELNPLGINCLRAMPAAGRVIWGARTLQGNDRLASEWKYLSVRRLALYIEESLYRGTHWVVFEPNDEPLWAQIRLNLGAFMHNLFRQGAFQGSSPREAYFVKCSKETTTQNDINQGVVNILIGFAPLKPAEFVIIKLQQMAGQIAA